MGHVYHKMRSIEKAVVCMFMAWLVGGGISWASSNSTRTPGPSTAIQKNMNTLFLSGVVIYGKERSALFEVESGNQTTNKMQVQEGEKIGGYTVDKVEKDRVVLSHNGKKETLLLKRGKVKIETISKEKQEHGKKIAGGENEIEENQDNVATVKRYAPGEINLEEHKEETQKGILKLLEHLHNFEEKER